MEEKTSQKIDKFSIINSEIKTNLNSKKKITNINLSQNNIYLEEIVREKVLDNIHEEIPFNLKFITEKMNWLIDNSYGTQGTLEDFF